MDISFPALCVHKVRSACLLLERVSFRAALPAVPEWNGDVGVAAT